jgi:fibronectin-binding autotransporter adhesin
MIMQVSRILLMAAIALLGAAECFGQSIIWNGGGDAASWSDPQNWVGQQVPGIANNAVITNGAGTNVVISSAVSVESILCNKALTISSGSLTVTAGASSLDGSLAVTNGATLSASGSTTTFSSSASVDITNANLYVSGGATLSLPGVVNCALSAQTVWQASGANSLLELTGLTNAVGPYYYYNTDALLIQALAGGEINLGSVVSLSGVVQVVDNGSGSEVNLSALQVFDGGDDDAPSELEPSAGGTILTGPLASLTGVTVLLGGGTLDLKAVTNLSDATLTVTNGAVTLPNVAEVDNANFYVSGGATLSLPAVLNCAYSAQAYWQASGTNSVLDLPGLTNAIGPYYYYNTDALLMQALAGGEIDLGGVVSLSGVVQILDSGRGSEVNLSALLDFDGGDDNAPSELGASSGGTILAGQLASLTGVTVLLGGGTLDLDAVTNLNGTTLTATNGTVTLAHVANIDNADFYVSGGATLSLPGVSNCAYTAPAVWQASGAGSLLDLTGLTNFVGPYYYYNTDALLIQALAGGEVNLGGAVSVSGVVQVRDSGSGSEVNLSALRDFDGGDDNAPSELEPSSGGTILTGSLESLAGVTVLLGGGTLDLDAVTNLSGTTLTVTNGTVTLPNATNIDNVNFYVSGGATLSLPGVANCAYNAPAVWQASGTNSVLDLAGLTNATGPYYDYNTDALLMQALEGGEINLGSVVSLSGVVQILDSGSGSKVNLPALRNFDGGDDSAPSELEPSAGGTILTGPLGSLTGVTVLLGGGTLNLDAVTNLSGSTLMVTIGTVTLTNVVNIDDASFYVSGGATLSLPDVLNCAYNDPAVWQASGTNSVLDLTGLTNAIGPYYDYNTDALLIQALSGGEINLGGVVSLSGVVQVLDSGGASVVNLAALQMFDGSDGGAPSELQPIQGGTILARQLVSLTGVTVLLGGGTLDLDAATNLSGSTLIVTNATVALTNVVNIDNANFYVSGGATLSLPDVLDCADSAPVVWQASGTNSVLDLTGLTNAIGPYYDYNQDAFLIQALSGGEINLGGLVSLSGVVQVVDSGSGSEVNLSALRVFDGSDDDAPSELQPGSGATILTEHLETLTGATVFLGGGTLSLNTVTNFSDSTLTVTSGTVTLSIPDINGASLNVSGGAMLSLTGVMNYQSGCANALWQASGAGSILDLPGLTNLQGAACGDTLTIQALSGGQVLLPDLQSITNGNVAFLSDDTGSTINLTGLSAFVLQHGQGSLSAENGGTILFSNQAFLLANVAVSLPAGISGLPATLIASDTLTLYGTAWHSYRVEERDTLAPGSPLTVLLVPLTNSFEAFAAAPPPNTAFEVTDFVANPPILQMLLTPDSEVQLVLYGLTNATYQIESTTNLHAPILWTPGSELVMTNAFRIFPETPPTGVQQFYRAEQQ